MTTAYKGFDVDLKCRGFQFEVGKTYTHDGPVELCKSGFHACENPMDVWTYYQIIKRYGSFTRYAEVEVKGDISKEYDKLAAGQITIKSELSLSDFVERAVAEIINVTRGKTESGDYAKIGSSGDYAKIGASGDGAKIGASGKGAKIGSSGDYAKIGTSGDYAQIGASGHNVQIGASGKGAKIGASGYGAQIGASGDSAKIGTSGDNAKIGASGDFVQIGASGYGPKIGASGYGSKIGASGEYAKIGASGDAAQIDCSGSDAVVAGAGPNARVRGKLGTWISLASFDGDGKCNGFGTGCIGQDGLEPDTWYRAEAGKLVKA